jgi:hypothetical protein
MVDVMTMDVRLNPWLDSVLAKYAWRYSEER